MKINKIIINSVFLIAVTLGTLGVFITKTYAEDNKIGCLLAGNKKWEHPNFAKITAATPKTLFFLLTFVSFASSWFVNFKS